MIKLIAMAILISMAILSAYEAKHYEYEKED